MFYFVVNLDMNKYIIKLNENQQEILRFEKNLFYFLFIVCQ
jgi:hypothetical protein